MTFASITQTSADATVSLSNAGSSQKTVRLHYRENGTTTWGKAKSGSTTGSSAAFSLSSLTAGTTYDVQAWLNASSPPSGTQVYEFTTLDEVVSNPSISELECENTGQTSATAMVKIADAGTDMKEVFLKHNMDGADEWTMLPSPVITYTDSTAIDLTGLQQGTTYDVAVALTSNFSGMLTCSFTTLAPLPSISGIGISDITNTSATATVSIANAGTEQKTVYLRYRKFGESQWGTAQTRTTNGTSATYSLAGLTPGTTYEVQASLASGFGTSRSAVFTTSTPDPSVSSVSIGSITQTSSVATLTIADAGSAQKTVHLQYRVRGTSAWRTPPLTATTYGASATIDLSGLTADTSYEVQASLDSAFGKVVSATFTTLRYPSLSGIDVTGITGTAATAEITIADPDGATQTVYLRYRTNTPRGDWSGALTTTSSTDSARIDLTGLTPGTKYDVQASLDGTFPTARTRYDTFTTLRYPSIASLEAEDIGENGATVTATIADSRGVSQTVYIRHRQTRYIAWSSTQQADSVDDAVSLRLRGLSTGTGYTAEASLDSTFPDDGTRWVTFTTKERRQKDDKSTEVPEKAPVIAPLPGYSPQMLRFVAIEGGDSPAPQSFSVWNREQGAMDFILSNRQEWLSQQPTYGMSGGPADRVEITVTVDSSGLSSGQYVDIIRIDVSASGRSPDQVIVVLDVLPPDHVRKFVSRAGGGTVILPDGTVKIVVQPLAPPKDVDIELMKVNLQAHGAPPGDRERVVVSIRSNTYEPGGDTPEDVAYSPHVELWIMLPQSEEIACAEGRVRVYSVQGNWVPIEHRCETDGTGDVWAVVEMERLGAFALVVDDSPATPTPAPATMATPANSVIGNASPATVRTSLPAVPPTPAPTVVPAVMPVPVAQAVPAGEAPPTPTATALPHAAERSAPVVQASTGGGGSGGIDTMILAAVGVPTLIGAVIVLLLLYRERQRRNGTAST